MVMARYILLFALAAGACLMLAGCPSDPDVDKKVEGAVKVPGLDEAIKAKDLAIKAAIQMGWSGDPELEQEQLAITDVHAGKVTITGIVSRDELKERAENIAKNQEGVNDVLSTITVDTSLKDKRLTVDESADGSS
jgi:osmotically-inducible protein OsmY